MFGKIIEDEKDIYKEILLLAFTLHHAVFNFSLMPTNGGLNRTKGRNIYDRPDIFLCRLKDVYDKEIKDKVNKSNIINKLGLNKSAEKSNDALIDFLCKTGSFKNWQEIFYHIDSDIPDEQKMLEDLLANGKNEIYDTKSLVGYIELAVQYWEHQKNVYVKEYSEQMSNLQNI